MHFSTFAHCLQFFFKYNTRNYGDKDWSFRRNLTFKRSALFGIWNGRLKFHAVNNFVRALTHGTPICKTTASCVSPEKSPVVLFVCFLKFLEDISPFWGPLIPLFWTSDLVFFKFLDMTSFGHLILYFLKKIWRT